MYALSLALLLTLVAAAPNPTGIEARAPAASPDPFCNTLRRCITSARGISAATAYCSSYLGIPAGTTTTVTATSTTVATTTVRSVTGTTTRTAPTSTTTVTTTITVGSTTTQTSTETTTTSVTTVTEGGAVTCAAASALNTKRAVAKPSCFNPYTKSAALSSACNCLSIVRGTATATSTSLVTSTTTVTSKVKSTVITTPTATTTQTETTNIGATTTVIETTSVVGTSTTSVPVSLKTPDSFYMFTSDTQYAEFVNSQQTIGQAQELGYVNFDVSSSSSASAFKNLPASAGGALVAVAPFGFSNQVQSGDSTIYFQSFSAGTNQQQYVYGVSCNIGTQSTSAPYICELQCSSPVGTVEQVCGNSNTFALAGSVGSTCSAATIYVEPTS